MKWNGYLNSRPVTEGCSRLRSQERANFSNAFIIDKAEDKVETKKSTAVNDDSIFRFK